MKHPRNVIRTTIVAAAIVANTSLAFGQTRTTTGSVRVDGRVRTYLVDLPPQHDGRRPLPVVVVFHGGGGKAESTRTQTHMSDAGSANGFIVVYPNGTGRLKDRLLTWNTGSCCGYGSRRSHRCRASSRFRAIRRIPSPCWSFTARRTRISRTMAARANAHWSDMT